MTERFSASNAAKHISCHASANLELAIPGYTPPVVDEEKGMKGEGSRMHELFEQILQLPPKQMRQFLTTMQEVEVLRSTRRFKVLTEETTTIEWLPSKPRTTVDLVFYLADELHILDFKWGAIDVPVEDNAQLMFYAMGFIHLSPKAVGVNLHIAQPKSGGLKSTFIPTEEMEEFMDLCLATDKAIIAKDLSFGPSDHCTFCPANPHSRGDKGRPFCPAMLQILYPPELDEEEILNG